MGDFFITGARFAWSEIELNTMETTDHFHKPSVLLLDVYETLLDMDDFEHKVNNIMDSKRGYVLWFEMCMQYCFVSNCISNFQPFLEIAKATMQMTARTLGTKVSEAAISEVLYMLGHLPIKDDVPKALSSLMDKNFRIAALTNAPEQMVKGRMERTGFISYFENVLCAEHIKKYKPCIEIYQWAASTLQVEANDILMVTAHGWDITGAANAGMQTAYVKQSTQMLYPLAPAPTMICNNLDDLCSQLSDGKNAGQTIPTLSS